MTNNVIIYEQPLNELIRVCLRLEQIFHQIDHNLLDQSTLGTRTLVVTIIQLLGLLDRPDIKAKLAKELSHHMTLLAPLEKTPKIDQDKLKNLLSQLDELSRSFIDSSGKIGQNLREIELFNTLRLHLSSPGGGCSFDVPVYHYWLQLPIAQRQATIKSWLDEFSKIRLATQLILQLIREGTKNQNRIAEKGFYQEQLDPHTSLRLVRVAVPHNIEAYPEISVSRHFVGVRFYSPNIHERPAQYLQNVSFILSYCS